MPPWLIFVVFLALGIGMTAWEPTRETLIGPIWLLFTVAIGVFLLVMVFRAKRLDRLRNRGTSAVAVARTVRETGLYIHEMPQVALELEVRGPGEAYRVDKKVVVPLSALEGLRSGEIFPVRIDTSDRDRLAFEWDQFQGPEASWLARGAGSSATVDPVTRLAQLDELRAHSDMTDAEYERLRAEIEADQ